MTTFNNTKTSNKRRLVPVGNQAVPEIIEAITPLFLATVGAIIGVVVLVNDFNDNGTKATAGLGLAGTAITGAAGLARTGRSGQDFSVKQEDGSLEVETPADR